VNSSRRRDYSAAGVETGCDNSPDDEQHKEMRTCLPWMCHHKIKIDFFDDLSMHIVIFFSFVFFYSCALVTFNQNNFPLLLQ